MLDLTDTRAHGLTRLQSFAPAMGWCSVEAAWTSGTAIANGLRARNP